MRERERERERGERERERERERQRERAEVKLKYINSKTYPRYSEAFLVHLKKLLAKDQIVLFSVNFYKRRINQAS